MALVVNGAGALNIPRTAAALAAYDRAIAETEDPLATMEARRAIAEALADETADRNDRFTVLHALIWGPEPIAWVRRLVGRYYAAKKKGSDDNASG